MRRIYIGLGSNLGNRAARLAYARGHFKLIAASAIYESPAMLPENAPLGWNKPYLNQVIEIETALSPRELLAELKRIESMAGRKDRGRWAPRELDLDIIAYGDVVLNETDLTLPHAGMAQRDFVLLPLRDIAPAYPDIERMIAGLPNISVRPWREHCLVMGILNVTPDSFSDGTLEIEALIQKFEQLVNDGADSIDIGAESTRPNAQRLTADEEWQRLQATLERIISHSLRPRVRISLDTYHPETASKALALGVDIINDVNGLRNPEMCNILRDALCDVVVMHSLTVPADKNVTLPEDCDVIGTLLSWKQSLRDVGIDEHRLIYDPGIGFGKTAQQSRAIIDSAHALVASGGRWLFGHSRKSFMSVPMKERDALTLDYSRELVAQGVGCLRVHDVARHADIVARAIEESPGKPGIDLTLDRVQTILSKLGNPQRKLPPVIHIAGTNGKGSTLAYLRAIYEAAGKRVHTYTSPHLLRYNERIILAGSEISDAQLMHAILRVRAVESEDCPITLFERFTAAAYLCFSETPADILLLETGMGGRLDATNLTDKIATIITPVDLDHMEFLGPTIGDIASEKAAIMRSGVPCVSSPQTEEAKKVITEYADSIGAPCYIAEVDKLLHPSLPGKHQQMNASVAAKVARLLGIDDVSIAHGIVQAHWPARIQRLYYGPLVQSLGKRGQVYLDGGHNPHAAHALAEWIQAQSTPVLLVCGMMMRKNAEEWMRVLAPLVSGIITLPMADAGAFKPNELAELAVKAGISQARTAQNWAEAGQILASYPVSPMHVLVAGSLYLAGDVLKTHG